MVDFEWIRANIKAGAYPLIGEGSGRRVYDLKDGNVVKMAKNKKGLAQSSAEKVIWQNSQSHLIAPVISCSVNNELLIMVKADKVKDMFTICNYFNVKSSWQIRRVSELKIFCKINDIEIGDFTRKANWGLIDGKPVIIDYGFTQQVRKRYYI